MGQDTAEEKRPLVSDIGPTGALVQWVSRRDKEIPG